MCRTACTEPQCLYKGALYFYLTVELYLYSPYGPYGLYRASVPVQGTLYLYLTVSNNHTVDAQCCQVALTPEDLLHIILLTVANHQHGREKNSAFIPDEFNIVLAGLLK